MTFDISSTSTFSASDFGLISQPQTRSIRPIFEQNNNISPDKLNSTLAHQGSYTFNTLYHPYVCQFLQDALMMRSLQELSESFFENVYNPSENQVLTPYPLEKVDFSYQGAYSLYNWELFFHAPLLIADRLSQNQRFEEANRWYHFIFNPTSRIDDPTVTGAERFWMFLPFHP